MEKSAAVLGLGIIGSRACSRLAQAGRNVSCWNRTSKGQPGEAETPEAAIQDVGIISIHLKDAPAVRAVVDGVAPFFKPGQIVLNHATLDLETTKWLETICIDHGCRFPDTLFTGSKMASANGQLFHHIGGDAALAGEMGLKTPAIKAVSKRMGELCDEGLGDLDFSALAKPYLDTL